MPISTDAPTILTSQRLNALRNKVVDDFSYFSGKNIVYMDYPVHNNMGDHLIYWGAMNALNKNGNTIVGQFTDENYNKRKVRELIESKNAIIVCHGGGNFGDLYPKHQNFRLILISDFPKVEIIIMPQSVYYESPQKASEQLKHFCAPNIKVHVRDSYSFDLLTLHHVNVLKTPDCAHFMQTQLIEQLPKKTNKDHLIFRRRDSEAIADNNSGFDWEDLLSIKDRLFYKFLRAVCKVKMLHRITSISFRWYSLNLIGKALKHFTKYNSIDTDRLHGFILALIMQKPVIHSDNSYHKIERYKSTWLVNSNK